MEFTCKYARPSGEIIKAVLAGQNIDEVRHHLQEQGLLPIEIRPRGWSLSFRPRKRRQTIKPEDFILFNQQFVALIRAGLPILKALDLLKAQIRNPLLRHHIVNVRDRVFSGTLLSEALRAQGVFPTVYTASIFAGERSGNLVEVINRYVQYEKTVLTVRKKFLNSLIYPTFLIVLSIVMVGVILTYVIPKFAQLYADLNTPLPITTRLLIAVSATIQSHLALIVPLILGALVILRVWAGTGSGRHWVDELKLTAPIVGNLWTMFSMAQLSRTLATLLSGGIPLVGALEVARDASGNRVIGDSIRGAITQVREGNPLSDSLERTGHFPDLALEMIRVGEQTGSLPDMLNHVADFYDEDVNLRSTALLSWVEPVILLFVAAFIAMVLISLYMPIFSIGNSTQT
ncbi:MAG TPA: type II secretion system F family protein [Terriglobia bacterium]|nr:type II secretion system F family protein [Terriglobia bacterium]